MRNILPKKDFVVKRLNRRFVIVTTKTQYGIASKKLTNYQAVKMLEATKEMVARIRSGIDEKVV